MEKAYYPKTIEEALEILEDQEVEIIAGGTDVMLRSKKPYSVMFIGGIGGIKGIVEDGNYIIIGSAVTMTELLEDEKTKFLKGIIASISSPAIRNWATIGGNICNASPIGDLLPALYTLDGLVNVIGRYGERNIAMEDFVLGRKKIDLRSGELVKEVTIYKPKDDYINFWFKVGGREANALSKVNMFSTYRLEGSRLIDFRLAIGGIAPRVVRDTQLEKRIMEEFNNSKNSEGLQDIFKGYREKFSPVDDQRSTSKYKIKVAENIYRKLMEELVEERC